MSAISRKSLSPLQSCCKRFSEKKRALAAWCTASPAFPSAPRWNWKSFSSWGNRAASNVDRSARKCNSCFSTISDKLKGGFMATTGAVATMKVGQISKPGAGFQIVEREIPEPGAGNVRIKVQACGVFARQGRPVEGHEAGFQVPPH